MSKPMRWTLWAGLLLGVSTTLVLAQEVTDSNRMTVTLSDPGRPAMLDVRTTDGSITVRTHNGRDIIVTTDDDVFGALPGAEGLRRLTTGILTVDEDNNVVTVRGDRFDGVDVRIEVPVQTNLRLETFNDEIDVDGVEGEIEATSRNDTVTLTNVAGSVVAHSQNDGVRVTMTRVTPDTLMAFSSVNDDVDVTLPSNVRANMRMSTVNGDIFTDFDLQTSATATSEANEETDGRVRRRSREQNITGTVNGGGPEYEFRTVNGNIFIRRGP